MYILDSIVMETAKTKEFKKVLEAFKIERKVLFVVDIEEDFDNAYLSLRNLPNVYMTTVEGLTIYDLQNAGKLVMTKTAAKKVEEALGDE